MAQVTDQPDTTVREDPTIKCPVLHHYGMITTQPDVLIEWYGKVVGVERNLVTGAFGDGPDSPYGAWVGNDTAHHRIAIIRPPGLQDLAYSERAKYPRVQHSAWQYPTVADLMESYERIRDAGIRPVVCTHHGNSVAFYYKDPDGNLVELLADAFGDAVRSREYLRTSEEIRRNPMGSLIDPDKMLAAYHKGPSDHDLQARAFAGEFVPDETPDLRQLL